MTTWLDPGRARDLTQEYLDSLPLGVEINNYCYVKSQVRITRDVFFVDLREKLNYLLPDFDK